MLEDWLFLRDMGALIFMVEGIKLMDFYSSCKCAGSTSKQGMLLEWQEDNNDHQQRAFFLDHEFNKGQLPYAGTTS